MIQYLHVCLLPVPSIFAKNCLLWISHHWKAPLSWTQITLPSNIHSVTCRSMYVLVALWICLCHSKWHLRSLQHKSVQIAPVTQILAHYISNRTRKTHHLVKASYSQHNFFKETWFILLFIDGHWIPVKRLVKSENRCHIILGRLFCNKVHCW